MARGSTKSAANSTKPSRPSSATHPDAARPSAMVLVKRRWLAGAIALFVAAATAGGLYLRRALAPGDERRVNIVDGAAIGGHDPVAYFTEQRPVLGSAAYSAEWSGATWRFASAAN